MYDGDERVSFGPATLPSVIGANPPLDDDLVSRLSHGAGRSASCAKRRGLGNDLRQAFMSFMTALGVGRPAAPAVERQLRVDGNTRSL